MSPSPSQPAGSSSEKPAGRRIQLKLPESYKKVDDSVWEDLESYLFTGFLTSPAIVADKSFVFKTLNHQEIRNIGFLKPMRSSPATARAAFRAAFIAHSVFIVEGENALHDRPRHLSKVIRVVSKLGQAVQEKIVENLGALNQRASRLHPLTEVYVHENRSRYHWLHLSSVPPNSPLATGLPGTEEIGMNYCQQTWVAVNRLLDKKEEAERDWANAKFVGSCFNGKGVRSIDEKDRMRREKERTDLEDRKMQVLFRYLNRVVGEEEGPSRTVKLPDGRDASVVHGNAPDGKFRADSAEELLEQLSAALSGEKDHHDLVVEAHTRKLMERARHIDDFKMRIYAPPAVNPPGVEHADGNSGVRILGGKSEADAYLSRMQKLRMEHHANLHRQVRTDLSEGSDEPEGRGD